MKRNQVDENFVTIELPTKMVVLKVQDFDPDIDVDDILRIDYGNLIGEILTFPLMFNRVANLRAEIEAIVSKKKVQFAILEAELYKKHKITLSSREEKRVTDKAIDSAVLCDPQYIKNKNDLIDREKDLAYLEALYWSAKSKDDKLNKLSDKLRPEEFERDLVEGVVNSIMIKVSKKSIV